MDTERVLVPAVRSALAAACPALADGTGDDAVAGVIPAFVASPSSTQQASALLRAAAGAGLAVVPRGAGTGLAWGGPPSRCDLVVDLRSMDQIVEHEDQVTGVDLISLGDGDLDDGALHRRGQRVPGRGPVLTRPPGRTPRLPAARRTPP